LSISGKDITFFRIKVGGFDSCHCFGLRAASVVMAYAKCALGENLSKLPVRWADMPRMFIR